MPKALEAELKRRAKAKGFGKERTGTYVYGTLRKTGWNPSTQKKSSMAREVAKRGMHKMPGGHMMKNAEMKKMMS